MPKARDEDAFMADLLAGLDDSFFNAVPSPDATPKKKCSETSRTTAGSYGSQLSTGLVGQRNPPENLVSQAVDENLDQLLEGAEDWDWNDMNGDFLSPKKASPKKSNPAVRPNFCDRKMV